MLAWLDHYTAAAETLIYPLAAIPIRANAINLVLTKEGAKLFNRLLRAKWWPYLAHCIKHGSHSFFVGNSERETVTRATGWVNKRRIQEAPVVRPLTNAGVDARFNALARNEALNVTPKQGAIFGSRPGGVFFILFVDKGL